MALPDGPELEVTHLERGRQGSLLQEVFKQEPGCIEEILVGSGLAQMTSEGSRSPETRSAVSGREGEWRQRIG